MPRFSAPAPVEAVIFDCDGTLVDSEDLEIGVVQALAAEHGVHFGPEEAHARLRGVRMAECVQWIASQMPQVPPGFAQDFVAAVRERAEAAFRAGLQPFAGAHELLGALALPRCIATNGPRAKVELTLQLTGLRTYFGEHVYCAYEVGSFKPAPGLFLHAAARLGVPAPRCAVLEDSVPGLRAGVAAGMQAYSLLPTERLPADLAQVVVPVRDLAHFGALLELPCS